MEQIRFSASVILADGSFPVHEIPLGFLRNTSRIICCDGAARSLIEFGIEPFAIVGDCDSLNQEIIDRYSDRIFKDTDQESNDLTKAVMWCHESGYNDITILGATGKREDHTIGNISLLADYSEHVNVKMVTDTGVFIPFRESCKAESFRGQQISIFSIDPSTEIKSAGLLYPLNRKVLKNWWEATLNEALGDYFELMFNGGPIIVFLKFRE